ncbi:MAG: hypothetical protein ACREAY_08000 [Nitrososphaera sp.]|uniref:hypothetical protein n=1 Tax=Nitrososphaera sp. TaxID=1971748 RepID=UPI003D6E5C7F
MSGHDESGYKMTGVAAAILVMGLSLAVIILMWVWFGHIGPRFSDEVMLNQQDTLRDQYGLPPAPEVTAKEAQIPPSLRNATAGLRQ